MKAPQKKKIIHFIEGTPLNIEMKKLIAQCNAMQLHSLKSNEEILLLL